VSLATVDCGPCDSGGEAVVERIGHLPPAVRAGLRERLDMGEQAYGEPLRMGWPDAPIEAGQEALDLVAYLLAGSAPADLQAAAVALAERVLNWRDAVKGQPDNDDTGADPSAEPDTWPVLGPCRST
jgi:hypothetical protein